MSLRLLPDRRRPTPSDGDRGAPNFFAPPDALAGTGEYSIFGLTRAGDLMGATLRERRVSAVLVVFGVATLGAALYSLERYLYGRLFGEAVSARSLVPTELVFTYLWALLTPAAVWCARRFPVRGVPRLRNWMAQAGAMVAVTLLHIALLTAVQIAVGASGTGGRLGPELARNLLTWLVPDFVIYCTLLAIYHALVYYRVSQDRALRASQLEARLAQSQLQSLRMQIQPHFLFNALHSISALMHRDVERADSMIAALSELLRMSLRTITTQEVSVDEELTVLGHYLEIMSLRFGDRVTVETDVDPATLRARLPTFCLQPLVENAFRHGFSDHPGRGHIRIVVRRQDDVLRCEVEDDGRGLARPSGGVVREGVGLSSTRARMRHLYGDDQRLDLEPRPGGGTRVALTLPFRPVPSGLPFGRPANN